MKHIILSLIVLIFLSSHFSCQNSKSKKNSNKSKHSMMKGKKKIKKITKRVEVELREFSTIVKYKDYNAILQPQKNIFINSQSNGIITKLDFDMGKKVKKGELLAVIDTRIKKLDLDLKKVIKEETETNIKYLESLLKKDKVLLDKNILRKEVYEASENRLINARFAAKKAEIAYKLSKINYNNSFIYAPFSGLIVNRLKQKGDIISMGAPIAKLIDNNNLEVVIGVTWEDLMKIKKYSLDKVVELKSSDKLSCTGRVSGISELLDDITRLYPLKVLLKECPIINGTQVKVSIPISEYENSFEIKRDILSYEDNNYFLFTLNNNKAVKVQVQVLDDNRDKMIVKVLTNKEDKNSKKLKIISSGYIGLINNEEVLVVGENESN